MELFLFGVLAVLFAIGFNYAMPKLGATSIGTKYSGSYAGRTALTAVAFMVVLVVAAALLTLAHEKPSIPAVV